MQIVFSLILALHAAIAVAGGSNYPNYKLQGMTGFAKLGGTTGGGNGPVVNVNNLADLQKYLTDLVPRTLIITKNISSPKMVIILLGANKSIIGSWKANVINNVYFHTSAAASNIIFQNLLFLHDVKNIGNGDTQLILDHGERYWIDHCSFDGQQVNENDLGKLLKVATVDYVTVSNCKFVNHYYGLILGYPSNSTSDIPKNNNLPRMTIMFNYFENIDARAPGLMRFGKFHVYNNYINNCKLGFTIHFQSKIYSEKNYFNEPEENFEVLDDKGNGYFKDVGSVSMPKSQVSKQDKWNPSSDYEYKTQTPEYSRDFCKKYSGVQSQQLGFPPA